MKENYDQAVFSQLLKIAIGARKKKEFAALIGISPEYLSRLINGKSQNAPSNDLLKAITRNAAGNITYSQLLEACGYSGKNESTIDLAVTASETQKYMKATILTALEALSIPWTLECNASSAPAYDLAIALTSETVRKWYFRFLASVPDSQVQTHLSESYLSLIFQSIKADDKYSLVTCSKTEYQLFLNELPVNLNVNLSIILIDGAHLEIQEESWLSKAIGANASIELLHL